MSQNITVSGRRSVGCGAPDASRRGLAAAEAARGPKLRPQNGHSFAVSGARRRQ
jgi:hypothetical protein